METYNDELAQEIQRRGTKIKVHVGTEVFDGEIDLLHLDTPRVRFFIPVGGRFLPVSSKFARNHLVGVLQLGFIGWNWLTCENNPLASTCVGSFWPYPQHGGRK